MTLWDWDTPKLHQITLHIYAMYLEHSEELIGPKSSPDLKTKSQQFGDFPPKSAGFLRRSPASFGKLKSLQQKKQRCNFHQCFVAPRNGGKILAPSKPGPAILQNACELPKATTKIKALVKNTYEILKCWVVG